MTGCWIEVWSGQTQDGKASASNSSKYRFLHNGEYSIASTVSSVLQPALFRVIGLIEALTWCLPSLSIIWVVDSGPSWSKPRYPSKIDGDRFIKIICQSPEPVTVTDPEMMSHDQAKIDTHPSFAQAMTFLRAGSLSAFVSHTRYLLTLRSRTRPSDYHSLIVFRLSPASSDDPNLYAMESTCPHLGADLSHADVEFDADPEIEEMTAAVVCPWHRYDFDLKTGESSTGLKACAYPVELRDRDVWIGAPGEGEWEVVEKRPVSEGESDLAFPASKGVPNSSTSEATNSKITTTFETLTLEDNEPEPGTLMEWSVETHGGRTLFDLRFDRIQVALTRKAAAAWRTGKITSSGQKKTNLVIPPDVPPRENLVTVEPGKVGKRGKAGSERSRIAILHALANIEQWAWDIIARFGSVKLAGEPLPPQFFTDWVKVAEDEAKHFSLLSSRLTQLGTYYGSQAVHAGLWDSASRTAHSLPARLCIIHLVHEARGLDVNPVTINKFKAAGDTESVKVLEVIHWDEVTVPMKHVTAGHRWFTWACNLLNEDPVQAFRREVRAHFSGALKVSF
ncbi:Rieske [2Fe-2S] domain-containing protein [Rhizoctonia solani AG-1 IA]|uniref:Rieske [2Fe-2S] domain-containing protein n=1 Tax=Thanatephorus cucumeris (strain AG1-IA) TaxID=983506 RepID=L8WJ83_THACA|nr:Rieske [2Fe-2S] domain-containing protein [Rhizoctonia solani AG-1 IA]